MPPSATACFNGSAPLSMKESATAATTQRGARKLSSSPKNAKPRRHTPTRTTAPPIVRSRKTLGLIYSRTQLPHDLVEVRFALESYARQVGHRNVARFDPHAVGEPAERLEQVRVRLVSAQAEAGGDVQRHLVAAVGHAARRRPAIGAQHVERAQVLDQAIAQRAVELQP